MSVSIFRQSGFRLPRVGNAVASFIAVLSFAAMAYFAYQFLASEKIEFANAFTGAGAVLAACISALVAYRSIAIVEEGQRPYPYPYIDVKSRYGLSLLKVKNAGGSAAHDIYFEWDGGIPCLVQPSGGREAQTIRFASGKDHAIGVLMPGEEQATPLGVNHWVAGRLKDLPGALGGNVVFWDARGKKHKHAFKLDTSFYAWALSDETELLRAQYGLAKLPEELGKIQRALEKINGTLQQ